MQYQLLNLKKNITEYGKHALVLSKNRKSFTEDLGRSFFNDFFELK